MSRRKTPADQAEKLITPRRSLSDLDLPESAARDLAHLVADLTHAGAPREAKRAAARPCGRAVLFAGADVRTRRQAAEALAGELRSRLLRVDLGAVDSAWTQETEANLDRVLATAEELGAVLLVDEADDLLGRRSDVKDSHDRYAYEELAYLLTHMDDVPGLLIVASSSRPKAGSALRRRFSMEVDFSAPRQ